MRLLKILFIGLFSLFALTACGDKDAKDVGKAFLEAVYQGDTDDVLSALHLPDNVKPEEKEMVKGKIASMAVAAKEKANRHNGLKSIEFVEESGSDELKKLRYKVIHKDDFSVEERIQLIKTKDGWKVKI